MSELPMNSLVCPLLTDMYQISMTYAHWKNGRTNDHGVFDIFFRKNPFQGEFCIFAGLDEVIKFLASFKFSESDIEYLKTILPKAESDFFEYLKTLDCKNVKLYAMAEGTLCFPKEVLIRIEAPLSIGHLLETTTLNLINYPSLIATNAVRMRLAAGPGKVLLEFGLRRAQGPDGAMSASKYSYIGGFSGTSNVLSGKLCGLPVKGTHAHAYVMSYQSLRELCKTTITSPTDPNVELEFLQVVLEKQKLLPFSRGNEGELAAFTAFAQAFPSGLVALVDTYDTLGSGIPNFLAVSWALLEVGYKAIGIRLDSGDLAYLSRKAREMFKEVDKLTNSTNFGKLQIVASNDINEDILVSLNNEGHEIDSFGIGTHLVTCQKQPALGCVYKLVEVNGCPRIKLSQELEKLVIPGRKVVYRLFGADGKPLIDVMQLHDEEPPKIGERMLCRHPFIENKRANVVPSSVQILLELAWDGEKGFIGKNKTMDEKRDYCKQQIDTIRADHVRSTNPTPYKISVSEHLYDFIHKMWMENATIAELC